MIEKDFWHNSKVAVIGGGAWGTALANLVSKNCLDVRFWVRNEDQARAINATRTNQQYLPEIPLSEKIHAFTQLDRVFEGGVNAVIWALPSSVCRAQAKIISQYINGEEIILHATKGIEHGTLKRVTEILREELPCPRIGVLSGPNLAHEVAKGEPAATVVASAFQEVIDAGQALFVTDRFRIYGETDVIGVEWAGALKNVLAIASGALDGLKYGWNTRALLLTRGLAEIVRFSVAMGGRESTFLGLAGMGDLLATCSSPLSRNYRVGLRLAQGEKVDAILTSMESVAEGVRTTESVWEFARARKIEMPITEGVYHLIKDGASVQEMLHQLMTRPNVE